MKSRELDRNAGAIRERFIAGCAANGINRIRIGLIIARRIILGACAFAEHVERITINAALWRLGFGERVRNCFAEHEMIAEYAHRLACGCAHGR